MATNPLGSHMAGTVVGSLADLRVCGWGRVRGSDGVHAGVMRQRHLALNSGPHPSGQGGCPSGIGPPVTCDAHKPGCGAPSWHVRAVGKSVVYSVGNCTRHAAQMARASEEDSGTQWDSLARSLISENAAGQKSSRRERSTPEPAHGGVGGDDQPQAWDAGLRRRARAKQRLCA
jgi:hypothetical protein